MSKSIQFLASVLHYESKEAYLIGKKFLDETDTNVCEIINYCDKSIVDINRLPLRSELINTGVYNHSEEPIAVHDAFIALKEERVSQTSKQLSQMVSMYMDTSDPSLLSQITTLSNTLRSIHDGGYLLQPALHIADPDEYLIEAKDIVNGKQTFIGTWGLPGLDASVGKLKQGSVNIIAGQTGSQKTFALLRVALANIFANEPKRVVFVNTEMNATDIAIRIGGMEAGIMPTLAFQGLLQDKDKDRYSIGIDSVLSANLTILEGGSFQTIDEVLSKLSEINADIVCIDSAYLIESQDKDAQHYVKLLDVYGRLHAWAVSNKKAIVTTHQLAYNKADMTNPTIGDIALGKYIAWICDTIVALVKVETPIDVDSVFEESSVRHSVCTETELVSLKARNGTMARVSAYLGYKDGFFHSFEEGVHQVKERLNRLGIQDNNE